MKKASMTKADLLDAYARHIVDDGMRAWVREAKSKTDLEARVLIAGEIKRTGTGSAYLARCARAICAHALRAANRAARDADGQTAKGI